MCVCVCCTTIDALQQTAMRGISYLSRGAPFVSPPSGSRRAKKGANAKDIIYAYVCCFRSHRRSGRLPGLSANLNSIGPE